MSTPIEALAQDASAIYEEKICKSDRPLNSKSYAYRDYKAGYEAGAKAASGQAEALLKHCDQVLSAASSVGEIQFKTSILSSQVCDAIKEVRVLIKEALSGAGKGVG